MLLALLQQKAGARGRGRREEEDADAQRFVDQGTGKRQRGKVSSCPAESIRSEGEREGQNRRIGGPGKKVAGAAKTEKAKKEGKA